MNDAPDDDHLKLLRQQTVLARFGELALRSDGLDEILTEACRLVGEALGTDLAKVVELQGDGETLQVRAGVGWKAGVVGVATTNAHDNTSEAYALKTGEPMISPDISQETRFEYPSFLTENGVRAVANVVIIGGKGRPPFGILQIDSHTSRQFTDVDTAFLGSYANLLAAAVDRLRVITEVRDGKERLHLALEAGELGSWQLDLASGAMICTPRCDRIFGHAGPPLAWTRDTFLAHVLADDRERVARTLTDAVVAGEDWCAECRMQRADDGAVRWIEMRGRLAGARGNGPPTYLLGILADITARKVAEEAMQRSNDVLEARVAERTRELVEANARLLAEAAERERVEDELRQSQKMDAVGQLTGGIAHDFNNLLAAISGSLELSRSRVEQGRVAEFVRYNTAALTTVNRAAALTRRLLAFSRRQTLDPKPVSAGLLVAGMEELFHRTVESSIRIETRLADGLWPVLCDPNQLENALLNLVINARDAMPDGGRLLVEAANRVIPDQGGTLAAMVPATAPPGDWVSLAVTDTGAGMAPAVAARAFDPFFTTKPLGQGTGLGLSMIYGFVTQSGGHVELQSKEGQGTTLTILLPRHLGVPDSVSADGDKAGPAAAPTEGVVLVVEDEPNVRMVLADVLADLGYSILQAPDGSDGLRIVQSGTHIDVLLTDVGLPGDMNGRQLADVARQHRPGLKVLFVTGYADAAAVGDGLLDTGMQVMTKPFTVEALAAKIEGMMALQLDGGATPPEGTLTA
ncbi:MAG: ATP-binding protein [Janthinobacterium lividum]